MTAFNTTAVRAASEVICEWSNQPPKSEFTSEVDQQLSHRIQREYRQVLIECARHVPEAWEAAADEVASSAAGLVKRVLMASESMPDAHSIASLVTEAFAQCVQGNPRALIGLIERHSISPSFAHRVVDKARHHESVERCRRQWRHTVNEMVERHINLAYSVTRHIRGDANQQQEWVSEAVFELIRCVECYRSQQGRFSTYAYQRMWYRLGRLMKGPVTLSLDATPETGDGENLLNRLTSSTSDSHSNNQDATFSLAALTHQDEGIQALDNEKTVSALMSNLDEKQAQILTQTYGLGGCEPKTTQEVAEMFGVTRSRVSQIRSQALEEIKRSAAF